MLRRRRDVALRRHGWLGGRRRWDPVRRMVGRVRARCADPRLAKRWLGEPNLVHHVDDQDGRWVSEGGCGRSRRERSRATAGQSGVCALCGAAHCHRRAVAVAEARQWATSLRRLPCSRAASRINIALVPPARTGSKSEPVCRRRRRCSGPQVDAARALSVSRRWRCPQCHKLCRRLSRQRRGRQGCVRARSKCAVVRGSLRESGSEDRQVRETDAQQQI
jgi:hypothetical protein